MLELFSQRSTVAAMLAGLALAVPSPATSAAAVTVFAAASLKNALDEVNLACETETGGAATISYAASSALAKQIEQGAPADIFFSADLDWMAYLSEKGLTVKGTETRLLGNRIVLIAAADSPAAARRMFDVFNEAGMPPADDALAAQFERLGPRPPTSGNGASPPGHRRARMAPKGQTGLDARS